MTTSKSPRSVAICAYEVAKQSLPSYSSKFSPRFYSQPQLFALLILKQFFKTDYRGLIAIIEDSSDLKEVLELKEIPHYTTLQKAAKRLLHSKKINKLLSKTLDASRSAGVIKECVTLSAMDSTGMETGHVSKYFVKRKQREKQKKEYQITHYSRFPKLALVCDCASHVITGFLTGRGPSPDVVHFQRLLKKSNEHIPMQAITADAGYDSESNHIFSREKMGIRSIINPKIGRPGKNLPTGKYRREMVTHFDKKLYGQRWQSETVMFMLKKNLGEELSSKSYWAQCREMALKVLTHNLSLLMLGVRMFVR